MGAKVSHYDYVWDSNLPRSFDIRNFSDTVVFDNGVLAGKVHRLDLNVDGWFDLRYELHLPNIPNSRFQVREARVQLISDIDRVVRREFPLSFSRSSCRPCGDGEGDEQEILLGRISPIFLSPPFPQDTHILRIRFTLEQLELEKKAAVGAPTASTSDPDKSAYTDLLFMKPPDVKIVCGRKEFQAHKEVLAEKSLVFRQMFENEMTEALSGKVVLDEKEIAPTSVLQLLHYLYNGKMEESKDACKDLFVAGEKYDMQELKGHCENYLARTMIPEDAAEFYDLAETHRGDILMVKALQLLKLHKDKLFPDAAVFLDFTSKHPQLMFQLFMN